MTEGIDSGWLSARHAITRATLRGFETGESDQQRYQCRIQRSRSRSSTPAVAHAIDSGAVLAAVDRQRPAVRAWLYVAYAEPPWAWVGAAMIAELQEVLAAECRGLAPDSGLDRIAETAILDMRGRECGHKALPAAECIRRQGTWRKTWVRTWKPAYDHALDTLGAWNAEGLGAVRRVIETTRARDSAVA